MAKKTSALAAAASRRLAMIGTPKYSEEELAHMMFHAEERGDVTRQTAEDGSWLWLLPANEEGHRPQLKPTPKMLVALEQFAKMEHNHG